MEEDRCKGHCCMDIGIYVSPEDLELNYYRWLTASQQAKDRISMNVKGESWDSMRTGIFEDIWLLYPMLQFVKKDKIHPDGGVVCDVDIYHYTCKNFKDGNCTIYQFRPTMCRIFPNGFCGYNDCQCKKYTEKRPRNWKFGLTIDEYNQMIINDREEKNAVIERRVDDEVYGKKVAAIPNVKECE